MKIAVIGPGAMGLLYGGKLSRSADVLFVGNNEKNIRDINEHGVFIRREGEETHYDVKAVLGGTPKEPVDLVILFTKAYLTEAALKENTGLIGEKTFLLSLQNGAGHENILSRFVEDTKVLLGTTAQGSSRENGYTIVNSGLGDTAMGAFRPDEANAAMLREMKTVFENAGFPTLISDNIRQMVWNKLMINASSSVLSGVLQVRQGYVVENADAFEMCKALIRDICDVADAEGLFFDKKEQILRLENHLKNAPAGLTSIYTDIKNGRRTEVDYISGAVAAAARKHGISAPAQEMMVHMVHAMEGRSSLSEE